MGVLVDGKWIRDDHAVTLDLSKAAASFETPHEDIEVEGNHRYFLYVTAGCPFAARPWMLLEMLGMAKHVRVVRQLSVTLQRTARRASARTSLPIQIPGWC